MYIENGLNYYYYKTSPLKKELTARGTYGLDKIFLFLY